MRLHTSADDDHDEEEELTPGERRKAAAQILARGIRRLFMAAAAKDASPDASAPQPAVTTEKPDLPGVPSRALMASTKAG